MISDCGVSEPTPTLIIQPTPTPSVNQLEFRWANIGDREILQVKNILTPTSSAFSDRDTTNSWSAVYAFKFSEQAMIYHMMYVRRSLCLINMWIIMVN